MSTRTGTHDDGPIGLGVLILMTIALIAGQLHGASSERASDGTSSAVAAPAYRMTVEPAIMPANVDNGSIRELRVIPSVLAEYPEFEWSSDEALIREYNKAGF